MATADFVQQTQKGLKKSFDNGAKNALDKWINLPIFNVQNNDEWASIFTSTEAFSGTKKLTEHETPPLNSLGDGYSMTIEKERFGNGYEITEDDQQKMGDGSTKVSAYLTRQRNRCLRDTKSYFVTEIHKFLNYAFATTYFAAPDDAALCADTHTWKTGETFDNYMTSAFSMTAVDEALEQGSQIADAVGEEMQIDYDTIVVRKNTEAHRDAIRLFAEGVTPTAVDDVNIYEGTMKIVADPHITYANKNYWFLFDTKIREENPLYVGIGKYPAFTSPKIQDNESVRQNVTGYFMQGIINMPWQILGSPGTT